MNWQKIETGEVMQSFARFSDSWDEQKTVIDGSAESSKNIEAFNMTADGIPFSFRRVGNKHSIIFDGKSELIKKSTFDYFKGLCVKFFEDSKPVLN